MECWIIPIWLVCAIVGAVICEGKGRSVAIGLVMGLVFGPVGLIICAVLSADEEVLEERALEQGKVKMCPACAEAVKPDANVCRYCGHRFEELSPDVGSGPVEPT